MTERPMCGRLRRRWLALTAVLPAILLAACVQVPFSGPVQPGGEVEENIDAEFDFLPSGPAEGASQEEILAGFLAATTASQNNYRIARQYLAEDAQQDWNPYAGTLVRSREGVVARVDDATLSYTAAVSAEVDGLGRYSAAGEGPQELAPFRFVEEEGEWRIAELQDGILISQQAFPSAFSQHSVYYYDPAFQNLVPDLRWFPTRAEVASRIVRAVLETPTSWLEGAVVSAVPEGTALAALVTVTGGVAQVDLTDEVLLIDDAQRRALKRQLEASLRNVSNVASVQLTVDQNPVQVADGPLGLDVPPQVDARLLVRTEEGFGFLGASGVEPVGILSDRVIELGATAVTLGPSGTLAAALTDAGVWSVRTGEVPAALLDARPGLVAPSVDGYSFLWTATASGAGGIRATELNGTVHAVEAPIASGDRVVSIDVSRDDARVLLLLDGGSGPRLVVAAIIRDVASNVPVRLGQFEELPIADGTPIDAAWVDEVRVAALLSDADGALAQLLEIGGRSRSLGRPADAVQLVGGNGGADGLRALTIDGVVLEPRGSGWQSTGARAVFLGVQQ
ncbi:MAG: LpqB family beta-propeller domain-containing protein [Microcella sp.]|uniref:GerMN domain-containing protein n=1 Tax=Microcella sp. TaxID=1913979 RepID=UPI00271D6EA0|nr:GerMN domain-containing protein [Microcella sp.]MDO8338143.1 LpqB family beta-propeller domain-containing protein [Microcella sp.]